MDGGTAALCHTADIEKHAAQPMAAPKPPSEIARETLKLLAQRRLSPTPEHYQALYHEVAGTLPPPVFPAAPLRAPVPLSPELLQQVGGAGGPRPLPKGGW